MFGFLTSLFSSGVVNSVTKIASEAIETDKESAEAKALFVKTLDPNGLMRRELSRFASIAYGAYLLVALALIIANFYSFGDPQAAKDSIAAIKELFQPITYSWGAIVAASFGVNATNTIKGDKK